MPKVTIPLSDSPSQQAQVSLESRQCRFWIRQLSTGLYLDFWLENVLILAGCLCIDRVDLLRGRTLQLTGQLYFTDTHSLEDPRYGGLGKRFQLIYEV